MLTLLTSAFTKTWLPLLNQVCKILTNWPNIKKTLNRNGKLLVSPKDGLYAVWRKLGKSYLSQAGCKKNTFKQFAHFLQKLIHVRPFQYVDLQTNQINSYYWWKEITSDFCRQKRCWKWTFNKPLHRVSVFKLVVQ